MFSYLLPVRPATPTPPAIVGPPPPAPPPSFDLLGRSFLYSPGARFTGLLGPDFFQNIADQHHVHFGNRHQDTFNAPVTLWAWLSQVLSPGKACTAAVTRVLDLHCNLNRPLCSANNGAYCKARAKLPTAFVSDLTTQLGQKIASQAPESWQWRGHGVKMADGSVVLLQDTKENLAEYPQQRSQKRGTSFTCLRLVLLFCLATGVVRGMEQGAFRGAGTGEMSLLMKMLGQVVENEILLGDRYYCSYSLLALLRQRVAHGCFRLSRSRQQRFEQGEKLGEDDYLQTWSRPDERPQWLSKEDWDALPRELRVRVLRVPVHQRGFRSRAVFIGTTLLDPRLYPKEEIGKLYFSRWSAELDIRSLKQTLGMKMLSCKTPEMVRTELWMHLLGYNLARCVLAEAAWRKGLLPRQLSFSGAVQTLDAFRSSLSSAESSSVRTEAVLTAVATHRVGNRPDRYEPREIKHRQRKYPELRKSRQERRQELASAEGREGDNAGGGSGCGGAREKGRGRNRPSGRQR